MRRLIVLPALVIALMLVLPGTAQVGPPLIGQVELDFYLENPIWRGPISGDINGWIEFTSVTGWARGMAWHFGETWAIRAGENGPVILAGTDGGIISPDPNTKYVMNGIVTEAGPGYEHLIGRNVHASGYVTWDPEDPTLPVTAPGTFRIN